MFTKEKYFFALFAVTLSIFNVELVAQDADGANVEEVITTGSRISRPETATSAPVTVVSSADIAASGLTDLGEVLRRISATQGSTATLSTNNGGSGGVKYSLRGIGTARTLVLLNGRRVVPMGNGAAAAPDLSHIPTAMVERIEILKDGASAIYGSDAMAGVVNIITKKIC
jgi:iron complex outermembrane receptor protein